MRLRSLWAFVAVAAFAYCAWRVAGFVGQYRFDDVLAWFSAVPARHVLGSVLFAAGSYAALTGFDYLGVRYAGHRLSYPKVALASFVSIGVGYQLAPAPLGTGAVRYFYYTRLGLGLEAFARLALLIMVTTMIGKFSFAGLVLLYDPSLPARWFGIDEGLVVAAAVAALACLGLYILVCASWRPGIQVGSWRFAVPSLPTALAQVAFGTLNYFCIAGCLHQLMSASAPISYATVASAYVFANFAVLLTHVPGGWGVMEFVILSLVPQLDTIGALIAFRVIYYLAPLVLGGTLLLAVEGRRSVAAIRQSSRFV